MDQLSGGGSLPNEPAHIWLNDEKVDVWKLKGELRRIPPIILLSACDTHAADRNHATTATGFLSLGATTVIGSFFPLLASEAAVFLARLLLRIADFIPTFIKTFDRAICWNEVVGGMLRMTLLSDYMRKLRTNGLLDDEMSQQLQAAGNMLINQLASDAFDQIIASVTEAGVPEEQAQSQFKIAVSTTSAISYIQLGRPETLILDFEERISNQLAGMSG